MPVRGVARREIAAAALVAAASSLCVVATARPAAAAATGRCAAAARPARFFDNLTVDGVQRNALVNVPPHRAATRLPVVLAFHGAGGTGPLMDSSIGLSRLADRDGFVAVYPSSNGKYWNDAGSGPAGGDDVSFVRALLADLDARLCVDDARVYATGVSNGGGFVARLGCELSDRLAAIAPVAGLYGVQPPCTPVRPVSVLEVHGTADGTVPYNGFPPTGQGSVAGFLALWYARDACAGPVANRRLARGVVAIVRAGCAAGSTVAHVKLIGGPHAWPSSPSTGGPAFATSRAVWEFFRTRKVGPGAR